MKRFIIIFLAALIITPSIALANGFVRDQDGNLYRQYDDGRINDLGRGESHRYEMQKQQREYEYKIERQKQEQDFRQQQRETEDYHRKMREITNRNSWDSGY